MKIGLLSDTHNFLDEKIFRHFEHCDEIWHAGDIGEYKIAETLASFKPFKAVYGNIDSQEVRQHFPEDLEFQMEGLAFWITHIAGAPPNYNPRVKKRLKEKVPQVLICGHSHILRIRRDPQYNNMLYLNPGAAGNQGFHHIKTIVRFDLSAGEINNMEVIELGKRGELKP
jgi:putative phosphoesterase